MIPIFLAQAATPPAETPAAVSNGTETLNTASTRTGSAIATPPLTGTPIVGTSSPTPSPQAESTPPGIYVTTNHFLVFLLIAGLVGYIVFLRFVRTPAKQISAEKQEQQFRDRVATYVLTSAIWGLIILAIFIVLLAGIGGKVDAALDIFNALLPVFGTWVGTLLAFYFSRENFEAATKSVTDIARGMTSADKLGTLFVREKMIRDDQIATLPKELQGKDEKDIRLSAVVDHLKSLKLDRLPLFEGNSASGRAKYVVHLSNIHRFLARKTLAQEDTSKLMLSDLLADAELAAVFKRSFTCIAQTCTLADAKKAMDAQSNALSPLGSCYDVFVTATGAETEKVIGWITNDIINDNAKV